MSCQNPPIAIIWDAAFVVGFVWHVRAIAPGSLADVLGPELQALAACAAL